MGLIRKRSSPKTIEANRTNRSMSHGPVRAARSAGRLLHGILAKVDPFTMQELGEDPADYTRLSDAILNSLQPQDAVEQALAEEMVDSSWRKRRLLRGEAGQHAEQRRSLKLQRQHKLASESKRATTSLETKLGAELGMIGLPDSKVKFEYILLFLRDVAAAAELGEFSAGHLGALQMIYGPLPSMAAGTLISFYKACVQSAAESQPSNEAQVDVVRRNLRAEIKCFETLQSLHDAMEISTPSSLLDSRLLLSNKDSRKLNRYEITLATQFYQGLDRFMEYRRFRLNWGTTEAPPTTVEGSPDEARKEDESQK